MIKNSLAIVAIFCLAAVSSSKIGDYHVKKGYADNREYLYGSYWHPKVLGGANSSITVEELFEMVQLHLPVLSNNLTKAVLIDRTSFTSYKYGGYLLTDKKGVEHILPFNGGHPDMLKPGDVDLVEALVQCNAMEYFRDGKTSYIHLNTNRETGTLRVIYDSRFDGQPVSPVDLWFIHDPDGEASGGLHNHLAVMMDKHSDWWILSGDTPKEVLLNMKHEVYDLPPVYDKSVSCIPEPN